MRDVDTRTVFRAFISAVRFFYNHGPRLIAVSVLWFLCSLPMFTVGPATLGAYAAVASLREGYRIDRGHVVATVKRHGVSAVLLSGVPLAFAGVATLYVQQYLVAGSTTMLVLGVITTYATVYGALVLIPTFGGLATGDDLEPAVRTGIQWTGRNPIGSVMVAMGTVILFVVTGLLTIAFVILFGGIAFSFHLETLLGPTREDERTGDG